MRQSRSGNTADTDNTDTDSGSDGAATPILAEPPVPWEPPVQCVYRKLLSEVIDPELGINIVDLGLVYGVLIRDGTAWIRMTMTTPGCPLGAYFDDAVRAALTGAPGVDQIDLRVVWDPPWEPTMMSNDAKSVLGWRR